MTTASKKSVHLHFENFFTPGAAPFWERLPEARPRKSELDDAILLTRYEDCRAVLGDRRFVDWTLKNLERIPNLDPRFFERRKNSILSMEGPDHQRLRRLAMPSLTPAAVDKWRPHVRTVMERNFTAIGGRKECEAVSAICRPLPVPVVCAVLGAPPEDIDFFSETAAAWTRWMSGDPAAVPEALKAHDNMDAYMVDLVDKHRRGAANERGDCLIAELIRAEEDGDRLTSSEIVFIVASLIIAGTDTVRFGLGNALVLFSKNLDQWRMIAEDPSLAPGAVEELLRYASVFPGLDRLATEDTDLNGLDIPQGSRVTVALISANRDETYFPDANRFDIKRKPTVQHLTFGGGRHFCLGAHLARVELEEALKFLAPRMPDLRITGPIEWMPPHVFQGPTRLPIAWS
ncbi:MAG: cytochrome P450 [Parvularculaceae bacterium]